MEVKNHISQKGVLIWHAYGPILCVIVLMGAVLINAAWVKHKSTQQRHEQQLIKQQLQIYAPEPIQNIPVLDAISGKSTSKITLPIKEFLQLQNKLQKDFMLFHKGKFRLQQWEQGAQQVVIQGVHSHPIDLMHWLQSSKILSNLAQHTLVTQPLKTTQEWEFQLKLNLKSESMKEE